MAKESSKEQRSRIMASIRSSNTTPEIKIRKILYNHGYRYRLNVKKLPTSPDIAISKYKTAILINGCFWHYHGCHISHLPKSNREFWQNKIKRNLERDKLGVSKLLTLGWRVLIIWECAINGKKKLDSDTLINQIKAFIHSTQIKLAIEGNINES